LLQIDFVYVKISFLGYYWLYVVVKHAEKDLREVCLLLPDLQKEFFEGGKRTVEDGYSDCFFIQSDISEGLVREDLPVTAPIERPQRQNFASSSTLVLIYFITASRSYT
jgi:hypothetical protein